MKSNFNSKSTFILFLISLLFSFVLINQAIAQEPLGESSSGTRIVISTSGPTEFKSYWLDGPPRLMIEFQSKNVLGNMDKEIIMNQGVIQKVTSTYFDKGKNKLLKSLTFELTQKVPYKIWQKDNAIILDIQAPLETSVFSAGGGEIFAGVEAGIGMIKRLEAMDTALMQVAESQGPSVSLETTTVEIINDHALEGINKAEEGVISAETQPLTVAGLPRERNITADTLFLIAGLALIPGLFFLIWYRQKLRKDKKLKKLELALQEKNRRLEQEETIRKAIEETSLQTENQYEKLSNSVKSLKGELVKKGLVRKELSAEEKEKPWISGKSQERRYSPRISLTKDYNRTIILKIKSKNMLQGIKSFAKDISSEGVCFETKKEFKEKEPINLRLFFYGDQVSMMKIRAKITWKKEVAPINYYGASFGSLEEKDNLGLKRYIESKIGKE